MGILNVTPDSFAEPGPRLDRDASVERAMQMEADGAGLLDIGGESTRPGAEAVSLEEESSRVLPVLRELVRRVRIPLSVDTNKEEIARACLAEGAAIINDITGLRQGGSLARVVAEGGGALILMHMRGSPATMHAEARYDDIVAEVVTELRQSVDVAIRAGVSMEQLIVDPGVGFAKLPVHSYGVLARLGEFAAALDCPVLVGPSRKSFMRDALDGRPAFDRDWGTAAAVTAAVLGGAHIVRVHAVAEMTQVVRVAEEIRNANCEA